MIHTPKMTAPIGSKPMGATDRRPMMKKSNTVQQQVMPVVMAITSPSGITTEWVEVTPTLARAWLDLNTNNRKVSDGDVAMLARAIREDRFTESHQGVAFDVDGRLVDGQHRLEAIIKADRSVWLMVSRNTPHAARANIDTGKRRRNDQVIAMVFGERCAKHVVSWVNAIRLLESNEKFVIAPVETEDLINTHRAGITWARERLVGHVNAPAGGALVYAYPADPTRVAEFADALISGTLLLPRSPALALREFLKKNVARDGKARRDEALRTLRAVHAHLRGETLTRVQPSDDALEFFRRVHARAAEAAR